MDGGAAVVGVAAGVGVAGVHVAGVGAAGLVVAGAGVAVGAPPRLTAVASVRVSMFSKAVVSSKACSPILVAASNILPPMPFLLAMHIASTRSTAAGARGSMGW